MTPPPTDERRPQACQSCINGCRTRASVGYGNESTCQETAWYISAASRVAKSPAQLGEVNMRAADVVQRYGLNSFVFQTGLHWLELLHEERVIGGGKVPSSLPWEKYGTLEFAEKLIHALSNREDIGKDLADGWVQAAEKWGRTEDLANGNMAFSYWGMPDHGYDPRAELDWGYGSILDSRDINEHCFNIIFTNVNAAFAFGKPMRLEAGETRRTGRSQADALYQGPDRRARFRRRQHVLRGRRATGALASPLHALLQAVGALLRPEVARLLQHQHAEHGRRHGVRGCGRAGVLERRHRR